MEIKGLSSAEVQERTSKGLINIDRSVKTRSIQDIFRDNICTLFNLVNVILAVIVFLTGEYKNLLFMVVIIANVCIGIFQEIRSKKTTDKLAIVVAQQVSCMRDGKECEVHVNELVLDDVIKLGRGDQIPADCEVLDGSCLVNESLLTGESDLINKKPGDKLMSGSFVNQGTVWAKVAAVGKDNYASKLTAAAKEHKALNSEIMKSLNAIIKYVSIILFPVGIILFSKTYFLDHTDINESILSTVSALVGMIPEGLILLTSTVLAVSVIRLAQNKVLVQQLYCIETLARVDTLCLDKTGTITTGGMKVSKAVPLDEKDAAELDTAFASLVAADEDQNETARAIKEFYDGGKTKVQPAKQFIPFASDTKWSGVELEDGAYVMGAAQFVLKGHDAEFKKIEEKLNELAKESRVILLAKIDGFTTPKEGELAQIKGTPKPLGFMCIADEIRSTAKQTIEYFKDQGVDIKVISGDDPVTVSGIAQKVGVEGAENYIDASTLADDAAIEEAIGKYSVFGRVKPEQKKSFVLALQKNHHVVAMTGDGVNDVMALKTADCSVAMASGSDAARNVAHLVLVDNDFAHMPQVVAEGRRSINNLQRSGSLFLVKTIMSLFLAVFFVFLPWNYPFNPIQMTVFSCLCIGIPSFVLALEPNHDIVRGHFLANCIVRSLPGGVLAIFGILAVNIVGYCFLGLDYNQVQTCSLITLIFLGIMLIIRISIPYNPIRIALTVFVIGGVFVCITILPWVFDLATLTPHMLIMLAVICGINVVIYNLMFNYLEDWKQRAIEAESRGEKDIITRAFEKYF